MSFGHSCWGAHGKRSKGPLLSSPAVPANMQQSEDALEAADFSRLPLSRKFFGKYGLRKEIHSLDHGKAKEKYVLPTNKKLISRPLLYVPLNDSNLGTLVFE